MTNVITHALDHLDSMKREWPPEWPPYDVFGWPARDICPWCGTKMENRRVGDYPYETALSGMPIVNWWCPTCNYAEDHNHRSVFGNVRRFLRGERHKVVKWLGPSIYG